MSIIVRSNHTRVGAWENSKMSGRSPLVVLYNSINRHAGISHKNRRQGSLDYNSICYIISRIGWVSMKGIYKSSSTDVDVILKNCPIPIVLHI